MHDSDYLSRLMRERMDAVLKVHDKGQPNHPWLPNAEFFVSPNEEHSRNRWDFGGFKGTARHYLPSTLVLSADVLTPDPELPAMMHSSLIAREPYWTGPMVVLQRGDITELNYSVEGGESAPMRLATPLEIACAMAQHPHAGSYSTMYSLRSTRGYHTYLHPRHRLIVVRTCDCPKETLPHNLLFVRTIPGQQPLLRYRRDD